MNWQAVNPAQLLSWEVARELIADGIKFVTDADNSGCKVYPFWIYEIDINSMLGKAVPQMYVSKPDADREGQVWAWTIGIGGVPWELNQDGKPPVVGGMSWNEDLQLDVWGFFHNDKTKTAQKRAEDEAKLISATIWRNNAEMVATTPQISSVYPLIFSSVQPTPFSNGENYIVATGKMRLKIREGLTE